ncbi:MAG: hypothetical protein WCD43_11345 [Candidatus Acidiferrales bacterium]
MNELMPGNKHFTLKNAEGAVIVDYMSGTLDWKAKVVCEACNNGWMSDIESSHAKPSLTDLIIGKMDFLITQSRARSIALFAFKTAVIFDHLARKREPFFLASSRHAFRESLTIPSNVQMWMAGFRPPGKGKAQTVYHTGNVPGKNSIEIYACTYAVGHLVIQIVGCNASEVSSIQPRLARFETLSVPFWPSLPDGFIWPAGDVLRTVDDLDAFSMRWRHLTVTS